MFNFKKKVTEETKAVTVRDYSVTLTIYQKPVERVLHGVAQVHMGVGDVTFTDAFYNTIATYNKFNFVSAEVVEGELR